MRNISEDHFLLGIGITFAIWVFGVLPFLYVVPRFQQYDNYQANTASQNAPAANDRPKAAFAAPNKPISGQNAPNHPGTNAEYHDEFWSAKLTDWLLAVFNFLLVVFTGLLYRATSGLFTETAGLRDAAIEQSGKMKESIDLAHDVFVATQRPKLRVRNIVVSHLPRPPRNIGPRLFTEGYAADSGASRTVIPTDRGQRSGDCGQFLMSV